MTKESTRYLAYLVRHGLDKKILTEYKNCGMLYYSDRVFRGQMAITHRFIDTEGADYKWISMIDRLELQLGIDIYHILHNGKTGKGEELLALFTYDTCDQSYLDYKFDEFRSMRTNQVLRLYPDSDIWEKLDNICFSVRGGGVVEESKIV